MVDNARLSSDRRTGPSASLSARRNIDRVEVMRSPSSVFYGSDAIGGVVHILTREPGGDGRLRGRLSTRFGTVNEEKGAGMSLAGGSKSLGFSLSFQGVDAEGLSLSGRPNLSIPLFSGEPPREGPTRDGKKEYLGRAFFWPGGATSASRTGTPGQSPPGIPRKPESGPAPLAGERYMGRRRSLRPSLCQPQFLGDPDGYGSRI